MPDIIDERGRFVGEAAASSHFVLEVAPGEHYFIIHAPNIVRHWTHPLFQSTNTLRVDAAAGRIYYVEVSVNPHTFTLYAVHPRMDKWARRFEWLASTQRIEPDRVAGQAYLDDNASEVESVRRRGMTRWAEYDASWRAERDLHTHDSDAGA